MTRPPFRLRFRSKGHPLGCLVLVLLLSWIVLEIVAGVSFVRDSHGAYAGRVVEVRDRNWLDHLTLEFIPVEHLIIETDGGRRLDKRVTVENRAFFRIEAGDRVVKARGFNNPPRVPGKLTIGEMLDAARDSLERP